MATKVDGVADQVLDKVKAAFKGNLVKGGGTSADVEISEVESPVSHRRRRRRRSKTTFSARAAINIIWGKVCRLVSARSAAPAFPSNVSAWGGATSSVRVNVTWRHEQHLCQRWEVRP